MNAARRSTLWRAAFLSVSAGLMKLCRIAEVVSPGSVLNPSRVVCKCVECWVAFCVLDSRSVLCTVDPGSPGVMRFSPKFVLIFFYSDTGRKRLQCDAMRSAVSADERWNTVVGHDACVGARLERLPEAHNFGRQS